MITILKSAFDSIVQRTQDGTEYWRARDLQEPLGYVRWENFLKVVKEAIISCETTGFGVDNHFREVAKVIEVGKEARREIPDYLFTRYACYLIAQNGDPKKEEVAFAQIYFALHTRKQEFIEDRIRLIARREAKDKLKVSESWLSRNIYEHGIDGAGFGSIHSKEDAALFGDISTFQMQARLGMNESPPIVDFLPDDKIKIAKQGDSIAETACTQYEKHSGKKVVTLFSAKNLKTLKNKEGGGEN